MIKFFKGFSITQELNGRLHPIHNSSLTMRVSDKLSLIDRIGRELQSRFGYSEIDAFLSEYDIKPPQNVGANSKWVYSKAALHGAPTEIIVKIADELDVVTSGLPSSARALPHNWKDTRLFRLFISHISKDRDKAARLKTCLAPYGISGFVAHEDIHPTLEWQVEIERALYAMDGFLAIHTCGFSASIWTQQEIGFAVARGVQIISFKMGEDPTGFISKQQALPRRNRTAEEIAKEVDGLLSRDERSSKKLLEGKKILEVFEDGIIPF